MSVANRLHQRGVPQRVQPGLRQLHAESYAGQAAGAATGVPRGAWDAVVGLVDMVTHPGETLQGLGRALDHVGRAATGQVDVAADADLAVRTWEAGLRLEQASF